MNSKLNKMEEIIKNKAKELINKMAWVCRDNGNYPEVAKQCAIIAIELILKTQTLNGVNYKQPKVNKYICRDYWIDLKNKIEKL